MENKPNNEISELLARLQQKVEKKSEPKVDAAKPMAEESTEALLSLLQKNIGSVSKEEQTVSGNEEYNISGYEFESEEAVIEAEDETPILETAEEQEPCTEEVEEILHSRVEELVSESVHTDEVLPFPVRENFTANAQEPPAVESEQVLPDSETGCSETACDAVLSLEMETDTDADAELASDSLALCGEEIFENTEEKTEETLLLLNEESTDATCATEYVEPMEEKSPLWEEMSDGTVEKLEVNKKEFVRLEDETAKVCLHESLATRFFETDRQTDLDLEVKQAIDSSEMDDVDINLALALGSREALEDAVGYVRVRSAKNGFYDPFWEEATAANAYGYQGKEFRSHDQTEAIKKRYISERKKIKKQFIFTFLLLVLILFLEHLPLTPLKIPYVSEWLAIPIFYYGLAVVFSGILILISRKKFWRGIRSLFFLHAEPFVPVSCLLAINSLYNLILLLLARESGLPVYNFAVALFLLFGIADDAMRLDRERLAFDIVSEPKAKLSLERFDGNTDTNTANAFSPQKDFFVEKIDFVGNFFTRSGRRPVQFLEYLHELSFAALGALLISLVSLFFGGNISSACSLFVFTMLLCVPMQFLTVNIYPFFHLTKGLSKLDSAVIGDAITDEYNDADTIYLEDTEMFGKHGARIVGLRVYNDMDFYEILSYALSVFTIVGAPLCNVFDNSAREIEKKDGVKITNVSVGGLEASIENRKKIYIGNLAFMRSRGYFPKRNPDDEKKIESGQISILYMAIDGELCAKIYMQYTVTQRFEKFAAEMIKNGIHVGIRTLDPNVNEKMIAALRNDKSVSIKVIRPTPNELIPIGKHSDSGIVTSKNSHMIFKILEQCFNIKRIHTWQRKLRIGALLLGGIASLILMLLNLHTNVPSLYIVIYQLLWVLPALIYTKSKLK